MPSGLGNCMASPCLGERAAADRYDPEYHDRQSREEAVLPRQLLGADPSRAEARGIAIPGGLLLADPGILIQHSYAAAYGF